ncbi:DUF389 domain-containing protein [Streptomyces sp. 15-116A]|uniref:DUF389 domain-containing protein n=1 Tax=Streptomyces sp. 15-116A TaxID=2259035 RepID=UPI0021B2CB77|nr:DUF389 domain-containing protein [Streptomyces sp. 15-116A]MCT7356705.1 DUF389 domain-containing protein [Streptomyces sp. 15-116A]
MRGSFIAAAGVLTDSTATVIGAMIIAPLSTPIMGIALGSVQRRRTGSALVVLVAVSVVVALGMLFSVVPPADYDLLSNSQISSRTSPRLMNLVAAMATGLAGAVALARRDVAAVLPGVAIAISLVPPLVVTGVCLGRLSCWLALGALALFVSKVDTASRTMHIHVQIPGRLPPVHDLLARLEGQIPDGVPVVVNTMSGQRIEAGRVGD